MFFKRGKLFLAFLLLIGMTAVSIARAEHMKAPEFPRGLEWINSDPLTISGLKGKVVLIDIWDYTCINCIRTLPYIKEWQGRYSEYGLVIVGVHTPEFAFAKKIENVKEAIERVKITYPVVLDNDYKIWSLYANRYWPRKYLIDADGYIVYDHAGEGDYRKTELLIQELLKNINPKAKFPKPFTAPGLAESGGRCYLITGELYLGYEVGQLGNTEGHIPEAVVTYKDNGQYQDGRVYANGRWLNLAQSLRHALEDKSLNDYIAIKYHALSANAVIKAAKESSYKVFVKQDDSFVEPNDRGEDIKVDEAGRTYLEIGQSRMYRIIKNNKFGTHALKLYCESDAFEIYAFTFGSCEKSD